VTEAQREKMEKERTLEVRNSGELNKYTCFKVTLPGYLPEGYKFDKAKLYKDEKGNVSPKYIDLYFLNEKTGKNIYLQQRFAEEETAFETGTEGTVEEVKVNGAAAVISDGRNMNWEAGNVLYILNGGDIGKSELMKIAESIK
jgi:hypothetical protein